MSSIHISLGTARTTPGALQTLRTESPSSGWVPTVPNSLMGTGSREIPQPWSIHRGAPRSHLKKGRRGLPSAITPFLRRWHAELQQLPSHRPFSGKHGVENIDLEGISTQQGRKDSGEQVVSEVALPSRAVTRRGFRGVF